MINVVVAEDKHPILRNLVSKIKAYSPRLQVVGEATDGLTALELCLQHRPHIVFTDIRMPGMDGLALIRQLKTALPDTHFVIISGYNDFEYAREGLRLGAREFLLKPVTPQALNEVLGPLTDLALSEQDAKEQQYMADLIHGRHVAAMPTAGDKAYYVLLICAGPIAKFHIDLANPFHDVWFRFDMPRFLEQLVPAAYENAWVYDGGAMNECIVIFRCDPGTDLPAEELYQTFCEALDTQQQAFTFAVSNRLVNLSTLRLEYQLTRMILENNAVFGATKLIQVSEYALNTPVRVDPGKAFDKQRFISYSKNKNKEALFREIESSLASWEQAGYTQVNVELCLSYMLQCAYQVFYQQDTVGHDLKLELNEVISISRNYHALFRNIAPLFERFFQGPQGGEPSSNSMKEAIELVDRYIRTHYAEELIIADIAEMVNFNVSFLSREFKKIKGLSPIEYLTQVRIEKAKKLILESSNHKFKDIGSMVGYSNPYYFSKVFKLFTGMSPSEYKNPPST